MSKSKAGTTIIMVRLRMTLMLALLCCSRLGLAVGLASLQSHLQLLHLSLQMRSSLQRFQDNRLVLLQYSLLVRTLLVTIKIVLSSNCLYSEILL